MRRSRKRRDYSPWPQRDFDFAVHARNAGASFKEIGKAIGRPHETVRMRLNAAGVPRHREPAPPISADDVAKIVALRKTGLTYSEIAAALKRSFSGVKGAFLKHLADQNGEAKAFGPPDANVLADRDRRLALAPRSTTAALLGDPLPGYSALDQRAMGRGL